MNKKEFLKELRKKLNDEKYDDVDGIIDYYDELIEDRIERTNEIEKEVIQELGSIDEIVKKVCGGKSSGGKIKYEEDVILEEEAPKVSNEKKKTKNDNSVWLWIVILILTSPLWFGLLMAVFGINIAIYATGFGIGVASIVCIGLGVFTIFNLFTSGLIFLGIGVILLGVAFIIIPLLAVYSKFLFTLVKKSVGWLVNRINGKGEAK